MANWVTLPNGVHIDLDDPHNPVTGDGDWSDLGGGDKGSSKESRSIGKYLDKNGHVTDATRAAYEKHVDKYYKEAGQIVKEAGLKDENLSYAHGLKVDYAKGNISKSELIEGFKENQPKGASSKSNFKAAPKDSDEFYEWYNSLSKEDRAFIDRSMSADKEEGAKYEKGKSSASLVKNYGMPVAVNWNGVEYPIGDEPDNEDMASMRNEYGLEKLGTVKVEGKTYTIYGSGYGNLGHTKQVAVEEIDIDDSWTKPKTASKKDDGFTEWYNSLSKKDREDIDRHMGANKKPGAKYKR